MSTANLCIRVDAELKKDDLRTTLWTAGNNSGSNYPDR